MSDALTEDDLMVECEIEAPPETVWRALTVKEYVAEWLLPNDLGVAEAGEGFALDGSRHGLSERIECEVLDAVPGRRLSYSWREADETTSIVTFELEPGAEGGTHLRVTHGPPPLTAFGAANDNLSLRLAA